MLEFKKFIQEDSGDLRNLLLKNEWPFHTEMKPDETEIQKKIEDAYYDGDGIETYCILLENITVGFVRIYDLQDETPLFDMRISSEMRGKGIGKEALKWLKDFIFKNYPQIRRIEGYTRVDNLAMRRVFEKSGFVKEAQHRQSWPGSEDRYFDAVGYAMLRCDWENNTLTSFQEAGIEPTL